MIAIRTTPDADEQIVRADAWWRENRPAAVDLFAAEFETAVRLIELLPDGGVPYRASPLRGVRRLLMRRTRFHVYYAREDAAVVVILAVWSAVRGHGPPIAP